MQRESYKNDIQGKVHQHTAHGMRYELYTLYASRLFSTYLLEYSHIHLGTKQKDIPSRTYVSFMNLCLPIYVSTNLPIDIHIHVSTYPPTCSGHDHFPCKTKCEIRHLALQ